ncbi:MAG: serine/threonine protein kinase, partial [Planctomycetota bacterium]
MADEPSQPKPDDPVRVARPKLPSTRFLKQNEPPHPPSHALGKLQEQFQSIVDRGNVRWTTRYQLIERLGAGSQGVVFLAERLGAHNISLPVALKIFSPQSHSDPRSYRREMERLSQVSMQLALVQQDHLLDVHDFVQCSGVSMLVMEWVDGFDLRYLLKPATLRHVQNRLNQERFEYLADAAIHRHGIVHADLKPSNIMLKRTGNAKVIDFGFAFEMDDKTAPRACTPRYAAVEVLRGANSSPASDLASLGYVLVDLLCGLTPFSGMQRFSELITAKKQLPDRLPELLPTEFARDERLLALLRGLIAPDPANRFPNAEAAD